MAYIRVSVHYSLDLKFYEVSEAEIKQRMQALENYGYSSYLEDGQLIVEDEIEIDDEYNSGKDVSEEIIWLLGKTDSDHFDYDVFGSYSESESIIHPTKIITAIGTETLNKKNIAPNLFKPRYSPYKNCTGIVSRISKGRKGRCLNAQKQNERRGQEKTTISVPKGSAAAAVGIIRPH